MTDKQKRDELEFIENVGLGVIQKFIPRRAPRALYIGCNTKQFIGLPTLLKMAKRVAVLESFQQYLVDMQKAADVGGKPFTDVGFIHGNAMGYSEFGKHDIIVWRSGPEHMVEHHAESVIQGLKTAVRKGGILIVGCPWGNCPQPPFDGNPLQEHVSVWYPHMLEKLGFKVRTRGSVKVAWSRIMGVWREVG